MSERGVDPQQVRALLATASRIVVAESPLPNAAVLFESTRNADAVELAAALKIAVPEERFHCMCLGAPALYAYSGEKLVLELTNHHGVSVRCSLWDSDAPLTDQESWLNWFDSRGIAAPRAEVEETRAREKRYQRHLEAWLMAMPVPLRAVWSSKWEGPWDYDVTELAETLRTEVPNDEERMLGLLQWFGSGAGPWSGYPAYEQVAEELLLEFSGEEIIRAVEGHGLNARQTEGLARLFQAWRHHTSHGADLDLIPPRLARSVTSHVAAGGSSDKIARLRHALSRRR